MTNCKWDRDDEVETLRAALKPFAQFAESHDGPDGLHDLGEDYVWLRPSPGYPFITTGHFRRAAAALSGEMPEALKEERRICAALYEALDECLREHGGFTIKGECERRARAALTKAQGYLQRDGAPDGGRDE